MSAVPFVNHKGNLVKEKGERRKANPDRVPLNVDTYNLSTTDVGCSEYEEGEENVFS